MTCRGRGPRHSRSETAATRSTVGHSPAGNTLQPSDLTRPIHFLLPADLSLSVIRLTQRHVLGKDYEPLPQFICIGILYSALTVSIIDILVKIRTGEVSKSDSATA